MTEGRRGFLGKLLAFPLAAKAALSGDFFPRRIYPDATITVEPPVSWMAYLQDAGGWTAMTPGATGVITNLEDSLLLDDPEQLELDFEGDDGGC